MRVITFTLLSLSLFCISEAQNGLQVDFERGYPLTESHENKATGALSPTQSVGDPLDDPDKEWRLPRTIIPIEYDLEIIPILDHGGVRPPGQEFTCRGTVAILVTAVNETDKIVLHMANSSYISTIPPNDKDAWNVTDTSGIVMDIIQDMDYHDTYQLVTLNLNQNLAAGNQYIIKVNFVSNIVTELNGLYRSSYVDPYTNTTKWIATTQMEALHARQVFPCFDEPWMKAVFYIKIGRRNDYVALTTTPSARNRTMPGYSEWVIEEFQPTVKMPTYLLAVIVSNFTYADAPDGIYPNKQVRTYAPPHYIDMGGGVYAAEKAAQLLSYFESYYREKYELGKMDSAAVPDFFFGAMENYGLNIYRETALLYMPDESTEADRFGITRILAHELGHQWFGNLVSPMWWTHIWLNEGFATFLGAQGADAVAPEYQAWDRYQNDAVQNAMGFDSRQDYSHSVKIDEESWIKFGAMSWFDRMAYEKAGSLILMMNGFLGNDTLQRALRDYLTDKRYDAAVQDDLFHHLNIHAKNESKIPQELSIKEIMDTWTLQAGYPLLRVSVANATSVFISQERFLNNDADPIKHNQDTGLWYIPMRIATKSNPTTLNWFRNDTSLVRFPTPNTSEWYVVNADANGFYRVIYDTQLTDLIKQELEIDHTFIPARTRSQLLDDYFNAAWQKYMNIQNALSLASYIGKEQEIVVWNTVLNNLRKPFNLFSGSGDYYTQLRNFLLPRLKGAVSLTGGISATLPEQFGGMRVIRHLQFLDWLCALEDTECQQFSQMEMNKWITTPEFLQRVRRDIRPVVYCSAIATGDDTVFQFIHDQYLNGDHTLKQQGMLLNSMACSKDVGTIRLLLEKTIAEDGFYNRSTHGTTIMSQLARNPLARARIIQFWRETNVTEKIKSIMGVGAIPSVITALSTYTSTQPELANIRNYIHEQATNYPELDGRTQEAIKTIEQNIQWVADFGDDMASYFKTL